MEIFLELGLILILVKLLGELFERLKLPSIFGEISLGIILGPVLGVIIITHNNHLTVSAQIIKILGEIGAIFLLFSIGFAKVDFKKITVSTRKVFPVTILGAIFPFLGGFITGYIFSRTIFPYTPIKGALLIGTALAATSIGVSVRTLMDLKYLATIAGATVLFAAVLDDFLSLCTLAIVSGIIQTGVVSYLSIIITIAELIGFMSLVYLAGKFLFPSLAKLTDKMMVEEATFGLIIGVLFVFSYFTHIFGLSMIIGAFLFGAGISMIPRLKTDVAVHKVRGIADGFFVPFFFLNIGLMFDFKTVGNVGIFAIIILLSLIVSQIIGGFLGAKMGGFNIKDSFIIGTALIPRNEIALVVSTIGLEKGILSTQVFSALVLMALVTTIITPLLLRLIIGSR
ncbi:MAG: cation:proton antiporter [bacterium]